MSSHPGTANDQAARPVNPHTGAMTKGRQADSARRRQRVITALNKAVSDGTEISVSGIARAAGVDRTSLQTDLLAAGERAARLHSRVQQLEKRLSEALGEQAWRESGLGTPADIDALNQKIIHLEQQAIDLRLQLEEQGEDLAAARVTNRELMAQLNTTAKHL
jgi:chromosome segregation ATPase